MLIKLTPWVNFTSILQAAFLFPDPRSAKDTDDLTFCAFGIYASKNFVKHVCEIDTWGQFHQHFTSSFCANILLPKKQTK